MSYLFLRSVFQQIQEHMRTDRGYLRTWPHKLHCLDKDRWSRESVHSKKKLYVSRNLLTNPEQGRSQLQSCVTLAVAR